MKKLKVFVLALCLLIVSSVPATAAVTDKDPSNIAVKELTILLKNPTFILEEDSLVLMKFIVNSSNQLVVLSTDTDNSAVDNFIKNRLNYKKLSCNLEVGKIYTQPIQLVKN